MREKQRIFFSELALNVYRVNAKISNYYKKKLHVHKAIIVQWSKGATNRYGLPVLRRVWVKGGKGYQTRYAVPFYVPLISTDFKRFTISLEPINHHYTGVEVRSCELTIHFKKKDV